MSSPTTSAPSSAGLRKLLNAVLVADSDLEAFCADYFPDVRSSFGARMDRVSKVNILLDQNRDDTKTVVAKLRLFRPAAVTKHEHLLYQDTPRGREESALSEQMEQLQQQLERDTLAGKDTSELLVKRNELRRKQRRFPHLNEGELLDERYRLSGKIGGGGFGDVWKAYDRRTGGLVAIKVLHSQYNNERSRVERFKRGALKMESLRHRYVVGVLKDPDTYENFHYFAMEYAPRGDLHKAVCDKNINRAQSIQVIHQAGEALSHAHKNKLIHRDIKPHNILLSQELEARLTDFDLVDDQGSDGSTRTGAGLGTFLYSSPEQQDNAKQADHRTDVYSLGMCLAFVVYGNDLPTIVLKNFEAFLQKLDCSEPLRNLIRKATDWDPEARHPTMDAFCQELRQAADLGSPSISLALPQNETRRSFLARARSRRPSLALTLSAAAIGISIGGGMLLKKLVLKPPALPAIEKTAGSPAASPKPPANPQAGPAAAAPNPAPPVITPAGPPKTEPPAAKPPEATTPITTKTSQPNPPVERRNWIDGHPPAPPIERGAAFAKIQDGRQQIDSGRSDLGYVQCYAATGNSQTRGPALTCMGEAQFSRGRYNEAVKLGKLAVKEGAYRDTFLLLGKSYVKLKNCKEARPFFLRVLNSSSGNPEALEGLDRCPP